MKCNTT